MPEPAGKLWAAGGLTGRFEPSRFRKLSSPTGADGRNLPRVPLTRPWWHIPRAAYQLIHDAAAAATPPAQIAEQLNASGASHPKKGAWTPKLVSYAIERLRKQEVPGFGPLPGQFPRHTLTEHVRDLNAVGYTVSEMVKHFRSRDVRTRHDTPVTRPAVKAALRRLRLQDPWVAMDQRTSTYLRDRGAVAALSDLAQHLNKLGLVTKRGRKWTPTNVREKLVALGVRWLRSRKNGRPVRPRGISLTADSTRVESV